MKKAIVSGLAISAVLSMFLFSCKIINNYRIASLNTEKPIKLSITWWGTQNRHEYTTELLEMYSKINPKVTFESYPAGWDGYFDKLAAQAAGNQMPDIIQMDYSYIMTYTKNNTLADLTQFTNDKTLDTTGIDSNLLNTGKISNKLTGIVISSSALALTYNPDVFIKANVPLPKPDWTWMEFINSMTEISQKTELIGIDKIEPNNYFAYWCRQNGKTLYASNGTKLGYEDDKLFIEFVNMLLTLQKAKAQPNPYQWSQLATKGKEAEPVVTGQGAATFDWSNFPVIVQKANPNLKLMTPPSNGTKSLYIKPGMFFSVAQSSKNQEEAAKFISWFINDLEVNNVVKAERGVPVTAKVRDSLKLSIDSKSKEMIEYIDMAAKLSTIADPPEPLGSAEVVKVLNDEITLALYSKETPEQAASSFRKKANEILSRNYAK